MPVRHLRELGAKMKSYDSLLVMIIYLSK